MAHPRAAAEQSTAKELTTLTRNLTILSVFESRVVSMRFNEVFLIKNKSARSSSHIYTDKRALSSQQQEQGD